MQLSRRLPSSLAPVLLLLRNLLIAVGALAGGLAIGYEIAFAHATWPITVIGIGLYVVVMIANPLAGLLFWAVTASFSRFMYLDIIIGRGLPDLTLTRLCAGILMVIVLAQLAIGQRRAPRFILLDGILLATLIGIGASMPASLSGIKSAATNFADAYLVPAIVYALARILIRKRSQAEAVCTAFVALGTILTSVALQEQILGHPVFVFSERSWEYTKDLHKLAGLLGSPAFFATLIAMSSAFAIYRFIHGRTIDSRLMYGALAAYGVLGVFVTYNRAGYLSLALNLLIMAVAWPRFRRIFSVVMLAGAAALILSWNTVQSSAVVTQRLGARGPIDYRLEVWGNAAKILAHNPIFGLGFSNFSVVYLQYNPSWAEVNVVPAPHNTLLEVFFNNGLIGGLPYLAMIATVLAGALRFYRRARSPDDAALILAFSLVGLGYMVQAMAVDMLAGYYVNLVLMLGIGALFGWQNGEEYARRDPGAIPDGSQPPGRG